jgi:FdhD protein
VIRERQTVATASCGICGTASIDDIARRCPALPEGPLIDPAMLPGLTTTLRAAQETFDSTGGLHAAGLFDPAGRLLRVREDVGRHNALDKLVGAAALAEGWPLHGTMLLVSGRVSFELVQKAAIAGIPVLAAVGAPTDLAVDTASRLGMTLIGFLRGERCNVYSRPDRLGLAAS